MNAADDGGQVFPRHTPSLTGITLRDYFAAKAMSVKFGRSGTDISIESMAKNCYEMADAMLEARKAAK